MKIEVLSDNTIKIYLSAQELNEFSIKNVEQLDQEDPYTRLLIYRLLEIIKLQSNIEFPSGGICAEVLPGKEDGCLLYLSSVNHKLRRILEKKAVFEFSNISSLIKAIKFLNNSHSMLETLQNSATCSLFYKNCRYRLLFDNIPQSINRDFSKTFSTVSRLLPHASISSAATAEHWPLITDSDVLLKLSLLLDIVNT